MRFHAKKDDVGPADGVQIAGHFGLDVKIAIGTDDAQSVGAHRLEMQTARDQDDVGTDARQPRANVAANGASARYDDSHETFRAYARATVPRWILPVAVRGMTSVM
jgi:hypothetical protein